MSIRSQNWKFSPESRTAFWAGFGLRGLRQSFSSAAPQFRDAQIWPGQWVLFNSWMWESQCLKPTIWWSLKKNVIWGMVSFPSPFGCPSHNSKATIRARCVRRSHSDEPAPAVAKLRRNGAWISLGRDDELINWFTVSSPSESTDHWRHNITTPCLPSS